MGHAPAARLFHLSRFFLMFATLDFTHEKNRNHCTHSR